MTLKFFNTLTKRKEVFKPLKKGVARIYACGPTAYDFAHAGNFRAYVFEDMLRRHLEYKGFRVVQAMNITDVDDKTIKGAREKGVSLREFTFFYEKNFFEALKALNIEEAEYYPKATEHVKEMIELINSLLKKGFAYTSSDGIYFSIKKFKEYGRLSGIKLKKVLQKARIKQDLYDKTQASDFALWKFWDAQDGGVFWETPWGRGRPGWHIECSAMSMKYLGKTFDIHSGGADLVFPHHENEIAQSEAATGKKFVNYWLHCKHLIVEGRKMSKSLGNFYTLRDLMQKGFSPAGIRWLLLAPHYREELNLTMEALYSAEKTVQGLIDFVERLKEVRSNGTESKAVKTLIEKTKREFEEGMDDDLNTPKAIAALFKFINEIEKLLAENKLSKSDTKNVLAFMQKVNKVLGILEYGEKKVSEKERKWIEEMIARREKARKKKEFAKADEIREELRERGIIVEDTEHGPRWRLAK